MPDADRSEIPVFRRSVGALLVAPEAPVRTALESLENSHERLALCADENGRLLGVLSDGDIRRGLLRGLSLTDPCDVFMNRDSLFVRENEPVANVARSLSARVNVIPVVDAGHRVVGYYSYRQNLGARPSHVRQTGVAVVGQGYVGLTLALTLASVGIRTFGIDSSDTVIDTLSTGRSSFYEAGIQSYMDRSAGRALTFSKGLGTVRADTYIVAVGTPVDPVAGEPNLAAIKAALGEIAERLQPGNSVIIRCTVPVGFTRTVAKPLLERISGLEAGSQFLLAVAPERTVEGAAMSELRTNPQIIGGIDEESAEGAGDLFGHFTDTVINVGSMEAAELCKLLDNCYRDHMFAFANQLVPLTESLDLDLHRIIKAMNTGYPRNNVPWPSPGVGGPCLSKDPYILASVMRDHGVPADLVLSARKVNEAGPAAVVDKVTRLLAEIGKPVDRATVSLIGIAFKGNPETSDIRSSTSLPVVDAFRGAGSMRLYDPVVEDAVLAALGGSPVGLIEAFDGADAVVVLNNHPSYRDWDLDRLLGLMNKPAVLVDTWRNFDPAVLKARRDLVFGGVGSV